MSHDMNAEIQRRINEHLGAAVVQTAALTVQMERAAYEREAAFRALDECIASGQVPQERVPALVASVPGFSAWRAAK